MKAIYQTGRALLATSLLMGFAFAHAEGRTVRTDQERLIKPGMTTAEVQSALGKPSKNVQYSNEQGRTWTYNVAGKMDQRVVFDVDFSIDGKVTSSKERTLPMGEAGSH